MPLRISRPSLSRACRFLISSINHSIPAKAGTIVALAHRADPCDLTESWPPWIPAFAGMTCSGHHPTLPSRLTASSFCASTANSIGSSFSTSLQKPLTISDSASSSLEPALAAIEQLVVADLRGRRLVLDPGRGVAHLDIGHGVGAAAVADQQRVALRVVARALGPRLHPHEAAIGVLAAPGRDALRDDRRRACSCRYGSSWCRYRPAGGCW